MTITTKAPEKQYPYFAIYSWQYDSLSEEQIKQIAIKDIVQSVK